MKNKLLKLPVFLGIVVTVCGTLLALVNSFTSKKIAANEKEAASKVYLEMYAQFNVVADDFTIIEDVEDISGVTTYATITNKCKGICYTCKTTGFGGEIKFNVGFVDGKYAGYANVSNSETSSYGGTVIAGISAVIKGVDGSTEIAKYDAYKTLQSGKSVTGSALAKQIEVCRAHYMSWYSQQA